MKQLFMLPALILFFICSSGNEVINKEANNNVRDSFFPIKEYGKWGYINAQGQVVIKCQFEWADDFYEGLAMIKKDSLYGFIDTTGKIVIEPKYQQAEHFSDGLAKITLAEDLIIPEGPAPASHVLKKTIAFIQKSGDTAFISPYSDINSFSYGRAAAVVDDKLCFIDKKGNVVIRTDYSYNMQSQFHDGLALLMGDDSTMYIDTTGKIVAVFPEPFYADFSEGLATVIVNKKTVYIDKTGKIKITPDDAFTYDDFSDGLAKVYADSKTGFIDTTGIMVISPKDYQFNEFKEGLVAYQDDELWGFINKKGDIIVKPQFSDVDYKGFSNGLCRAAKNDQRGYINRDGKFVWIEKTGFEYEKLDLSKWDLDTMRVNESLENIAGFDNYARKGDFKDVNELILKVDTTDLTVFEDKYYAYKLYLINGSAKTVSFSTLGKKIDVICQAINEQGEWEDIEESTSSFCGNAYTELSLKSSYYQVFAIPFFKGNFKTQFRYRLEWEDGEIYSNTFIGYINAGQFLSQNKGKIRI